MLFWPVLIYSQGEWNQWRFGDRHGLNFNSGNPVPVPHYNSLFYSQEYCSSVSDSMGNLLFYANDSSVYNVNNDPMPNGSGLLGSCFAIQQAFSVQKLDNPQQYFLFTMNIPIDPNYIKGLYYSVIDMTLDGGLGDIVPIQKNIPVPGAEETVNALTGTRHGNNKDVWIVVRVDTGYSYLSYRISSAGLNTTPILSNSLFQCDSSFPRPSMIRISQDGSKLICLYDSIAEYCNFNTNTGEVSPLFLFYDFPPYYFFNNWSTAEFSVDTKYLYIGSADTYGNQGQFSPIRQYDAQKTDSSDFLQSMILIGDNLG